jgi:hypothetical protein
MEGDDDGIFWHGSDDTPLEALPVPSNDEVFWRIFINCPLGYGIMDGQIRPSIARNGNKI